jgi:5'-phosphate synthase pdxT subunit
MDRGDNQTPAQPSERRPKIGVLALQGDFAEHMRMLEAVGAEAVAVRLPEHLRGLDGLIIPGGESTTIGKLMVDYNLVEPLRQLIRQGTPVWGTCAGLILLAREADNAKEGQPLLATMDIAVCRNAFGSQRESFEADLPIPVLGNKPFHTVFIRGPVVERVGPAVEVLARLDNGAIVAVRQDSVLGTAFHPEVTDDYRFHEYFVQLVQSRRQQACTADSPSA